MRARANAAGWPFSRRPITPPSRRPVTKTSRFPLRPMAITRPGWTTLSSHCCQTFAHARKISESVEQVEKRGVGSAKLTLQVFGRRLEQINDALRILMRSGRSDDEAHAILATATGPTCHLL